MKSNEPAIIQVQSPNALGKGSFGVCGQIALQIISQCTLVDVLRVPKACTAGK